MTSVTSIQVKKQKKLVLKVTLSQQTYLLEKVDTLYALSLAKMQKSKASLTHGTQEKCM